MNNENDETKRAEVNWKTWFIEKVMPGLVGGALVSIAVVGFGLFDLAWKTATETIGQSWLQSGSIVLARSDKDCPTDWNWGGQVIVLVLDTTSGNATTAGFQDWNTHKDYLRRGADEFALHLCVKS